MLHVIPKRKVHAQVRLADSTVLEGYLYTALGDVRVAPETVAERLNDPTERYMPLALENRHVLLRKASITSVLTPAEGEECGAPHSTPGAAAWDSGDAPRELLLRFDLSDGTTVVGRASTALRGENARALDYLNLRARGFLDLRVEEGSLLINESLVLAVQEVTPESGEDGG